MPALLASLQGLDASLKSELVPVAEGESLNYRYQTEARALLEDINIREVLRSRSPYEGGADLSVTAFEHDLDDCLHRWKRHGISAGRIPGLVRSIGVIETASLYATGGTTSGFIRVCQVLGGEDTIEGLVVKYANLFPLSVVTAAEEKLDQAPLGVDEVGYDLGGEDDRDEE